ncbi:hypothetical protein BB561_005809 [Smittium simulii]|uniref:Protein Zds1 C-terminal domain-containing protein n=1 Tax=Smittium simulii TaxID=133385 RepID=A0A2T9Y876_9FUNG|nr:hypothetical protein BB561_005809 [Smittium simulii]
MDTEICLQSQIAAKDSQSEDYSVNSDVNEWISSEIETIDELRKGTMSVQYPEGFQEDFDFLNQGNNIWLPARLHPGTAPVNFSGWLQEQKSQIDDTKSSLKRSKSRLSYSGNENLNIESEASLPTDNKNFLEKDIDSGDVTVNEELDVYFDSSCSKPRFMQAAGPRTSLKRSKVINRRRGSRSSSSRSEPSQSSNISKGSEQSSRMNSLDENIEVSLADLSLAESSEVSDQTQNKNISTADILKKISKEVCDMSYSELGFDNIESSSTEKTPFSQNRTLTHQNTMVSQYDNTQTFNKTMIDPTQDISRQVPKSNFFEPQNTQKIKEVANNDKILKDTSKNIKSGFGKFKSDPDSSSTKKKGRSFNLFGKSKSSSGKESLKNKDSIKDSQISVKKIDIFGNRSPSKNLPQATNADTPTLTHADVNNIYADTQSSRYPPIVVPLRPQPARPQPPKQFIAMNRFPIHVERAIYRLASIKLTNPRRPLYQQVLLSNMMFCNKANTIYSKTNKNYNFQITNYNDKKANDSKLNSTTNKIYKNQDKFNKGFASLQNGPSKKNKLQHVNTFTNSKPNRNENVPNENSSLSINRNSDNILKLSNKEFKNNIDVLYHNNSYDNHNKLDPTVKKQAQLPTHQQQPKVTNNNDNIKVYNPNLLKLQIRNTSEKNSYNILNNNICTNQRSATNLEPIILDNVKSNNNILLKKHNLTVTSRLVSSQKNFENSDNKSHANIEATNPQFIQSNNDLSNYKITTSVNGSSKSMTPLQTPLHFAYYQQATCNNKKNPTPSLPSSRKIHVPVLDLPIQQNTNQKKVLPNYSEDIKTLIA